MDIPTPPPEHRTGPLGVPPTEPGGYIAILRGLSQRDDRSGIPLGVLLDTPELMMTLLSPVTQRESARALSLVTTAVIELNDPRQYLYGHEFLLITGLGLPTSEQDIDEYVLRLCDAGVAALGFGVEPVYTEVPEPLIEACTRRGLPLVRIDAEVRFVQVTNRFSHEMHNNRLRGLHYVSTMARRLTKAALLPNPTKQLVTTLSQMTHSWVVLRQGEDLFQTGTAPTQISAADLVREYSERLGGQTLHQVFGSFPADNTHYEVTAIGIRPSATLATATSELLLVKEPRITSDDRTGLMLAADLLQLVLVLPRSQSTALDQLMMTLLVDEAVSPTSTTMLDRIDRLVTSSLGEHRRRLGYAITAISLAGESAHATDLAWWRLLLNTPFVDHRGGRLRAIVSAPPSASIVETCAERGWVLSVSSEHPGHRLSEAMREAELLVPRARELRRSLMFSEELGSLSALVPPGLVSTFSAVTLEPVSTSNHPETEAILTTLHSWLLNNGGWDATARILGLHRNTVRRYVSTAGALLGRDLDNALVRADLLVALENRPSP
ncbi:PucR family transcriptional regulator [Lysinibacter sp. HNR]|uniref:PucR family transcriptional regulator n=1 Tax=Lysinibacter sp. HNR TaxID=3031408 RepID=UPI00243530BD|nr:PucR family transcriptional regulator [Lysinibacter sp. HNR]WGD37665.1 PucR family transcriptional regulator [Lysinibacter sp. HNR]